MTDGSNYRLGGWTRLWLAFSAVWVVACSVVFFYTAPERESVELSAEVVHQYLVDQFVQEIKSGVLPGLDETFSRIVPFTRQSRIVAARTKFEAELRERGVPEQEITRQWKNSELMAEQKEFEEFR